MSTRHLARHQQSTARSTARSTGLNADEILSQALAAVTPSPPDSQLPKRHLTERDLTGRQWWRAEEDEKLMRLVSRHGSKNWVAIAPHLEGRTCRQCRERWTRQLQPQLNKSDWTQKEDLEIQKRVAEMGTQWGQISMKYMPSRSDTDIKNRWGAILRNMQKQKSPRSMFRRRPWSDDEDEQLQDLVAEYGAKDWATIATHFQTRTSKHCMERWKNHLRPGVSKGEWTPEDDLVILDRVSELGTNWSQIARQYFPSRTRHDIRNRWNTILQQAYAP